MRHFLSSFCRLIACFLVMTVLTSGIAMAAYLCPESARAPVQKAAMADMPCAGMDTEKPVQCAEARAGNNLALEHLAAAPVLTPVFAAFVFPASMPTVPYGIAAVRGDVPLETGADPPYLRTLRLRI
jgi:hypothetical protein